MTMKFMPGDEVRFLGYKEEVEEPPGTHFEVGDTAIVEFVWPKGAPYPYEAGIQGGFNGAL